MRIVREQLAHVGLLQGQVGSPSPLRGLVTDAGGTTAINGGSATTTGRQTYNDAVLLGTNTTLAASATTFGGTVNGASRLTVNAAGATTFAREVGNTTALWSLATDSGGATIIAGGAVTTSGAQSYRAVFLGNNTTLTGSAVAFAETVDGAWALTVNAPGETSFRWPVGLHTPLTSLTTDAGGTTIISRASRLNGVMSQISHLAATGHGLLEVNGELSAGSVSVNPGATMGGNGAISAPVSVQNGGTLSPGTSIGSLNISNSLGLFGTAFMELNTSSLTHDRVRGLTSLTYGGALSVINLSGTLGVGDTLTLFEATSYSGTFGRLSLPLLSNGLVWDTSNLPSNGAIRLVSSPPPRITGIAVTKPHTVQLAATGAANQVYWILATTNVALPTSLWWLTGMTNATRDGIINFSDTLATNSRRFYQLTQ